MLSKEDIVNEIKDQCNQIMQDANALQYKLAHIDMPMEKLESFDKDLNQIAYMITSMIIEIEEQQERYGK